MCQSFFWRGNFSTDSPPNIPQKNLPSLYHHNMQNVQTEFESSSGPLLKQNVRKCRCPLSKFYAHTWQLQMSKVIARLMARILLSCGLHDAFCTRPTVSPCSPQHYRPVVSSGNREAIAGKLKHTHQSNCSLKVMQTGTR